MSTFAGYIIAVNWEKIVCGVLKKMTLFQKTNLQLYLFFKNMVEMMNSPNVQLKIRFGRKE